jgi:hypothetical protein
MFFCDAENMREKIGAWIHTLRVAMPEENFLASWNVVASVPSLATRMYTREEKLHKRERKVAYSCCFLLFNGFYTMPAHCSLSPPMLSFCCLFWASMNTLWPRPAQQNKIL